MVLSSFLNGLIYEKRGKEPSCSGTESDVALITTSC
ncbi:hypothetical protein ACULNC_04935 [Shigella flexneri]